MDIKKALAEIEHWEGRVSHLYLDSRGNATIGIGCLIPQLSVYQELPMRVRERLATKFEIQNDWVRVTGMEKGHPWSFYAEKGTDSQVHLTDIGIDGLAESRAASAVRSLRGLIEVFDDLPEKAQIGTLDLCWCLGSGKLRSKYVKFLAAIRSLDMAGAARECGIFGAREARNIWRAQLFVDASVRS